MTSNSAENLHWFEKTIEYAFVLKHAQHLAQAIPLDGAHEKAGDTIFQVENARWLLIEFKRRVSDLDSEADKFDDILAARKALETRGTDLHFFVYGTAAKRLSLDLSAAPYWAKTPDMTISAMIKKGTANQRVFVDYVKAFIAEKMKRSSGGGGGGPDFSFIAAVGQDGKVKALGSVAEYFSPKPKSKPNPPSKLKI